MTAYGQNSRSTRAQPRKPDRCCDRAVAASCELDVPETRAGKSEQPCCKRMPRRGGSDRSIAPPLLVCLRRSPQLLRCVAERSDTKPSVVVGIPTAVLVNQIASFPTNVGFRQSKAARHKTAI